jgi:hypothetical protein
MSLPHPLSSADATAAELAELLEFAVARVREDLARIGPAGPEGEANRRLVQVLEHTLERVARRGLASPEIFGAVARIAAGYGGHPAYRAGWRPVA